MDQESVDVLLPNDYWNNLSVKSTRDRTPVIILAIQTFVLIIYTIFTFVFDYIIDQKSDNPVISVSKSSSVIYFSHLAIRLLCLAFKLYLDRYYHNQLKLYGYHRHHSNSTFLSELTHILFNNITLLLLLNSSVYQIISTDKDDSIHLFGFSITQTQVAKIIAVTISCVITFVSGRKLHVEIDFQRKNARPDTLIDAEDDDEAGLPSNDIGIRFNDLNSDLLKHQQDMIINLKMQNKQLKKLLMKAHEDMDNNENTERA